MGKNKKKGKAKTTPSSSRRSAELLSSTGAVASPVMIGFQNYPIENSSLGTLAPNLEEGSRGNVRLIVKTMLKKDVTTKLKGIEEFIACCSNDSEIVTQFLPHFPRIYNKLAMDTDLRVRQAIQEALEIYVPLVKKDITPYLKNIMPTWLITMADPCVGAAAAARSAFLKSFPDSKQSDAMMFCQSEILNVIHENLCKYEETPDVASSLTEEKHELLLNCSVRGLKLFISLLSEDDKRKVIQPVSIIVNDKRFWAHSQSTTRKVRIAWFELINILVSELAEVFQETKYLISLVISSLWKGDSQVIRSIWDCALQVFSTFKDWWCQIDVSSMIFIPLFEFLSSGGHGNATVVYPVLPELLCHLLAVDNVGLNFIMEFFNSLRRSFSTYKLKSSQQECDAVMLGFFECLKFVSGMLLEDQGKLNESRELIEKQLIPLIRYSFKSEGFNIATTSFYALLGLYLQDLEASVNSKPTKTQEKREDQNEDQNDDEDESHYCNILAWIWENLSTEIRTYLRSEVEGRQKDANVLILFFHSLHQPSKYLQASERKLYFYGESCSIPSDDNYFVVGNSSNIMSRAKSPAVCDTSFLFNYTVGFCVYLCAQLERNLRACYLELFAEVISDANCEETFCEMLQALHVPVSCAAQAPFIFFQTVTMDWMRRASSSKDDAPLDWIKDIITCICFCVTVDCAVVILDICSQFATGKLFQRLVVQMLEFSESHEEFICRWFHSPTFACVLESTTVTLMRMLRHQSMHLDNLELALSTRALMLAFANAGSEQPQIPWAPIRKILGGFSSIMEDASFTRCEFKGDYNMIDFICDAAEKLLFQHPSSYLTEKKTSAFVFRAFTLSLEWTMDDSSDTGKERKQLDNLWKTFIPSAIMKPSDLTENNFLILAAEHLNNLLVKGLSRKKQEQRVVEVICIFLELVEAAYAEMKIDMCESESVFLFLLKIVMPLSTDWEQARHGLHIGTVAETLGNHRFYSFINENLPLCSVAVPQIVFLADAVVELLIKMFFFVTENCSPWVQELYYKLLCHDHLPHVLWAVYYADSQVYIKAQDIKEPVVFTTLRAKCAYLMQRCNICHFITIIALRLFKDETWAVPFDKVLQLVAKETDTPLAHFPSFYPAFDELKRNHLSLTQSCLKHAGREFVEGFLCCINVDLFDQEYDNMIIKAFSGAISQVATCVEYHVHEFLPATQKTVVYFLNNLAGSKWFHEYKHEENSLLVTCFTSIAIGVMENAQDVVSLDLWMSIVQTAQEWFQKCLDMTDLALNDTARLIFVHKTFRLISVMSEAVQGLDQEVHGEVSNYWKAVFESDISTQLVKLFSNYAGKISELGHTSNALETLLFTLVQNLEYLTTEQIFEGVIFIHSKSSSRMNLSEKIDFAHKVLRDEIAHHLKSKSMCVQFGSHFLLKKMLVHLIETDNRQRLFADSEHEATFKALPLVELMEHTNELIEMVIEVMPTECCVVEPFTDSFTFAMANLLAWDVFFEYFSAFGTEEHCVYLGCLADSKMLSCMLMNVIRLRPEDPSACFGHIPRNRGDSEQKVDLHEMPPLYSLGTPSLKHLQHAACSVYVTALKKIPALVRTWWSNLEKRIGDSVERFTSEHISKVLISNEMNTIQSYKDKFNMTVDAYPSSRQVIATYGLDDTSIELTIKIPHNYPLGPVSATSTKKNIVEPAQWRAWMLQMSKFLNYHNGSVKDAIVLWKQNLDKKFEGVEECMICFFILQNTSGTLPNKTCRVCRKKFHGTCLFKWFKTSNSCSCPGCRTDF